MLKTQAKIEAMSTTEWHQYHQLLENTRLMEYFREEILRFAHSQLKPDEVLRRFSLNGDGQLDMKEFQLAVKRLAIISFPTSEQASVDDEVMHTAIRRTRELFSVFCPSQNKKLDVDLFCRIMNEWSLQLMRAQREKQTLTNNSKQTSHATSTIPTPYALQSDADSSFSTTNESRLISTEGEMIWRRIRDPVVQHLDKLSQIFSRMDITSSGCISQDEFELAMSHIGVFLTAREYSKLYYALPIELKDFSRGSMGFSLRYADFLVAVQGKHPQTNKHTVSTSAQSLSPPIATNARLWDLLVQALDRLEPLIHQYERAYQHHVSAETFRDLLMRCGIVLSSPDYAALRVRLLPFTDSNGTIGLAALLHALKAHDLSAMTSAMNLSSITNTNGVSSKHTTNSVIAQTPTNISPIRTGRRTVFPSANEVTNSATYPSSKLSMPSSPASVPHPAGKSTDQRYVHVVPPLLTDSPAFVACSKSEENRTIVKIRHDKKSDIQNSPVRAHSGDQRGSDVGSHDEDGSVQPLALERRILAKLQQLKEVGQLGTSSPQTVFPGDRFGRITRGQFRQSLVHLGVVARYAEVESLFWTLDPNGRGYIVNIDLYDHLNMISTTISPLPSPTRPLASSPEKFNYSIDAQFCKGRLPRSVQKVFEGMLVECPRLMELCRAADPTQTGIIARADLAMAIQELGLLASAHDVQSAIVAITQRVELHGFDTTTTSAPLTDTYHSGTGGIVYSKIEARLKDLCSDLLSPKKRRHLSTASVLLAPQQDPLFYNPASKDEFNLNVANETDALWNCPRRKMNQDHRAMKTSIQLTDRFGEDGQDGEAINDEGVSLDRDPRAPRHTNYFNELMDKKQRSRRVAMISILQDLLERRGELKCVMDLHPRVDVHGHVTKSDLIEILMASRLNLNFTGTSSGITVHDFVNALYPAAQSSSQSPGSSQSQVTVTYLDLLHRISDTLAELTQSTSSTSHRHGNHTSSPTPRRLRATAGSGGWYAPVTTSTNTLRPHIPVIAGDEVSLQRKLLYESRLQGLLTTETGRQSAGVLIRHAFKGVTAREMVVPIENGEYESVCRTSDLKYICYRLGLDLNVGELQYLASMMDRNQTEYISSPQLLQFLTQLAMSSEGMKQEPEIYPPHYNN